MIGQRITGRQKKNNDSGFVSCLQTDTARKMVLIEVLRLGSNLSGSAYQRSVANAVTNHEELNPPIAQTNNNCMIALFYHGDHQTFCNKFILTIIILITFQVTLMDITKKQDLTHQSNVIKTACLQSS